MTPYLIILFTLITALDTIAVASVLPRIVTALQGFHLYPYFAAANMCAFLATTPVIGKMADVVGCKKTAVSAFAFFVVGQTASACAFSIESLIFARFFAGIGLSGLMGIASISIGKLYESDHKRSLMQALMSLVWAFSGVVGPFLATHSIAYSWRMLFLISAPVWVCVAFFLYRAEEIRPKKVLAFDALMAAFFCVTIFFGFSALTVGVKPFSYVLWGMTCASGLFFVYRSTKAETPLIPYALLKNAATVMLLFQGFFVGATLAAAYTLISFYMQGAQLLSSSYTGYAVMFLTFGWALGSFGVSSLIQRFSLSLALRSAHICLLLGLLLFSLVSQESSLVTVYLAVALMGMGIGALINTTIVAIQKSVPHDMIGRASAFLSLVRSLGASVGAFASGALQVYIVEKSIKTAKALEQLPASFSAADFLKEGAHETLSQAEVTCAASYFSYSVTMPFFILFLLLFVVYVVRRLIMPFGSRRG